MKIIVLFPSVRSSYHFSGSTAGEMKCRCAGCCSGALRDWMSCLFHYMQWSIKWISACDKMISQLVWMWMNWSISSVFPQHYFLCLHKQQGISFNLFEGPSNLCFTFKSVSDCQWTQSWRLCTAPQGRVRSSQRATQGEKKTTRHVSESIWLTACMWQSAKQNDRKWPL